MSSAVDNFWDELAITQAAAGVAPSVVTKEMRKVLDGDEAAKEKMGKRIDMDKAKKEGLDFLEKQNKKAGLE